MVTSGWKTVLPSIARPKVLMEIEGESWLIKFPTSEDGDAIGREEYEYALCATACGIEVSQVALFPSKRCDGYFGTKRFDRQQDCPLANVKK